MRGLLRVDPADAVPIWRQIEEGLRRMVVSRALAPGAALPSVRELARELCVNPATVVKAYQRLVDGGVLAVKRGEGTFVNETPPALKVVELSRILHEGALRYASAALSVGASKEEAVTALGRAWSELKNGKKGAVR